jgi:L-rhamnose-H+ transport protein
VGLGLFFALASGVCNGLFTAPMKIVARWKWEHIWLVFILTSCIVMPLAVVSATVSDLGALWASWPRTAVLFALTFGFAWGFGAILFGLSVDRLGVSLANSLAIGLSSALGSLVPLLVQGTFRLELRQLILFFGILTYLAGVGLCGAAGSRREGDVTGQAASGSALATGYLFSIGAGVMSAVFNVGYTLALPVADAGMHLGYSRFAATNAIWLLMLGAGSIPNIAFCAYLVAKHRTAGLFFSPGPHRTWGLSILMGLLWGASIFLYGAATPLLGDIGPSIGWPLSLAVGLLVANLMGVLLGEWRKAGPDAVRMMRFGILMLLAAVLICAISAKAGTP